MKATKKIQTNSEQYNEKKLARVLKLASHLFNQTITNNPKEVKVLIELLKKLDLIPTMLNLPEIIEMKNNLLQTYAKKIKDVNKWGMLHKARRNFVSANSNKNKN